MDRSVILSRAGGFKVEWNQLVQNGDFADGAQGWSSTESTVTASNNVGTVTFVSPTSNGGPIKRQCNTISGHKYCVRFDIKANWPDSVDSIADGKDGYFGSGEGTVWFVTNPWAIPRPLRQWTTFMHIVSATKNNSYIFCGYYSSLQAQIGYTIDYKNIQCVDLTQMFGAGNEPSTVEQLEAWLQENGIDINSYIPYDAGSVRYMSWPSWIQGASRYRIRTATGAYSVMGNKVYLGNNLITPEIIADKRKAWISTEFVWSAADDSTSIVIPVVPGGRYLVAWNDTSSTMGTIFRYGFLGEAVTGRQVMQTRKRSSPQETPYAELVAGAEYLIIQLGTAAFPVAVTHLTVREIYSEL